MQNVKFDHIYHELVISIMKAMDLHKLSILAVQFKKEAEKNMISYNDINRREVISKKLYMTELVENVLYLYDELKEQIKSLGKLLGKFWLEIESDSNNLIENILFSISNIENYIKRTNKQIDKSKIYLENVKKDINDNIDKDYSMPSINLADELQEIFNSITLLKEKIFPLSQQSTISKKHGFAELNILFNGDFEEHVSSLFEEIREYGIKMIRANTNKKQNIFTVEKSLVVDNGSIKAFPKLGKTNLGKGHEVLLSIGNTQQFNQYRNMLSGKVEKIEKYPNGFEEIIDNDLDYNNLKKTSDYFSNISENKAEFLIEEFGYNYFEIVYFRKDCI